VEMTGDEDKGRESRRIADPGSISARKMRFLMRARQQRSARKRYGWFLALVGGVLLLLGAFWLLRTRVPASFPPPVAEETDSRIGPLGVFELYFGSSEADGLQRELRYLPRTGELEADALTVVRALIEGPRRGGLSPWPAETVLQDLFISGSGVIYLNFGASLRWRCPRGNFMEWLVVASLTRSLCANLPALLSVRILIAGESPGPLVHTIPLDCTFKAAMFEETG